MRRAQPSVSTARFCLPISHLTVNRIAAGTAISVTT
ncbi:MAG: hypothetical protein QOF66_934 [Mycobacterium sp.]|nr:hypothetical protein [Mycobacterium sp.]MDT5052568.1 hypothetical protein [Mycobacterium sp.]